MSVHLLYKQPHADKYRRGPCRWNSSRCDICGHVAAHWTGIMLVTETGFLGLTGKWTEKNGESFEPSEYFNACTSCATQIEPLIEGELLVEVFDM